MGEKHDYKPVSTGPGTLIKNEHGQLWRQFLMGAIANISVVLTGYTMGWTSPVNMKLKDVTQSPFPDPITKDQEAWIGSLVTVGAMFGPFVGGPLSTKFGRKWGLIGSSVPQLLGFILVAMATSVSYLYAARVLWGLAVGMIFTVCPMYCTEIATVTARGILGSFLQLFIVMGFLLVYAIGPYISYHAIAYVGISIVATNLLFFFLPETPIYHLMKGNRDGAAASLMTLRGKSRAGVEDELYDLTEEVNASLNKTGKLADVFRGTNFKAFYISCTLMFFQQFCGINAVLFYMTNIFAAAGSNLDADISTILIGVVQVLASVFTSLAIERLGRKMLLLISTGGTTIGLGFLGLYFLLDYLKSPVVQNLGFLPLVSLIVYILTYCYGLGPMPWVILSELLPIELKAVASPIATAFCWTLSFLITRYFGPVALAVGMHSAFFFFGACCALGFVFTILVVPETKGKSSSEIQQILAGMQDRQTELHEDKTLSKQTKSL